MRHIRTVKHVEEWEHRRFVFRIEPGSGLAWQMRGWDCVRPRPLKPGQTFEREDKVHIFPEWAGTKKRLLRKVERAITHFEAESEIDAALNHDLPDLRMVELMDAA